ncbi:glycoside hydrolase family 15 protein [Corallococcus carmarthensis]|uniref:Glycoside hydrolase family 15 protein n=1 Tax=Corallococcus carmarthensis TaxID=2316728 RepID=A0A3A8KL24_9BACT|nr:glycoside hydrolase family 15 protein [Corallococcus carmarthensis]
MISTETARTSEAPRTGWGSETRAEPGVLIEDHALLGDLYTAALVAKDGSIDFLCLPDFDSDACFTSLLGTPDNGRWKLAPKAPVREVRRRYRGKTLILETEFVTDDGTVRVVDFMPIRKGNPHLVRWVEGVRGTVAMRSEMRPRFANGYTVPLISRRDGASTAIAGPDAVFFRGGTGKEPPPFESEFTVKAGQRIPFVLSWARPYDDAPAALDPETALSETQTYWEDWASQLHLPPHYDDVVVRSLLTLKACSYQPSGALVAAPTFGLPETPGGERNWDYRFCWIRDSVLTLNALMRANLLNEAGAFGNWLEHAIGGAPGQLQIMYGIRGERRLTEVTLDWLKGYEGARPVRIGNGAYSQFQLDVLGEFAAVLYIHAELAGKLADRGQKALKTLATRVSEVWTEPDHGIWEMRGPTHSFTASKVSAWIVIDCWVRAIDKYGLKEDKAPWVKLRQTIHDEVCSKGYDAQRGTFTQYYGSKGVDASLLFIPLSGFLPPEDPRIAGTVRAIEEELMPEGLVLRYRTEASVDGLSGEEGAFLACSFWLANTYHLLGRTEDARKLFEKLVGLCNDVGLLAEEYLPGQRRMIGNFPQAFSHLALVNSAYFLAEGTRAAMYS